MRKIVLPFLLIIFALLSFAPMASADDSKIVKVGIYLNQISDVDLKSQSFAADLYIWFKWTNPNLNPDSSFEFMNAFDPASSEVKKSFEKRLTLPKGQFYQVIRYQGRFSSDISLRSYPFDNQEIQIIFEDITFTTKDLIYTADKNPISINKQLKLLGYQLSQPTLEITNQSYPTNFGDESSSGIDDYSRSMISFKIVRPIIPYLLKLIFPILLVVTVAALAFWIDPDEVEARVGMVVTALLTLVALQITTNSNLPEVQYLMLIDLFYNFSFAFVLAVMIDVVVTTNLTKKGNTATALKFGNRMRLSVLAVYTLAISIAVSKFYSG